MKSPASPPGVLRQGSRSQAEAQAWSIGMEGYGGPAQPSPTIRQYLNGAWAGWTSSATAARPRRTCLDAIRQPRDTAIGKLETSLKYRSCQKRAPRPQQVEPVLVLALQHSSPWPANCRPRLAGWRTRRTSERANVNRAGRMPASGGFHERNARPRGVSQGATK